MTLTLMKSSHSKEKNSFEQALHAPDSTQTPDSRLHTELLSTWADIEKIRTEWDALLDQTDYPTVYSTYDFCRCGWVHFHKDDSTPFIIVVRDKEKIVAIFPLRRETSYVYRIKYELILPLHTTETDKPYPLIAKSYERSSWLSLASHLKENPKSWDILYWSEVPDTLEGVEELEEAFSGSKTFAVESEDDAFGPILNLDQTWDEFKSKHRKLRKAITRINKKLEGGVHFKVYQTIEEIAQAVDIYALIELKGWKAGKIGLARNDTARQFYQNISSLLAKNGRIRIGILYHGEIPISAEIAYTSGDRVFFSHGTYDPAYKDVSPGKISTGLFIKEFLDLGDQFNHGDFLAGFAHYLSPWSDELMTTTEVNVYNRRPAVYAIWKWRKTKKQLKNKLKNNPDLENKIKRTYIRLAKSVGIDVDTTGA